MFVLHWHEKVVSLALKLPFKWGCMAASLSTSCSSKSNEGGFETLGFWLEQELRCSF